MVAPHKPHMRGEGELEGEEYPNNLQGRYGAERTMLGVWFWGLREDLVVWGSGKFRVVGLGVLGYQI